MHHEIQLLVPKCKLGPSRFRTQKFVKVIRTPTLNTFRHTESSQLDSILCNVMISVM